MTTPKQKAEQAKERGNKAFGENNFDEAIKWYSEAIKNDNKNHVYFSNRSAAYVGLRNFSQAMDDADMCIKLNRTWGKGYYRKAVAQLALGNTAAAFQTLKDGLAVDGGNGDLKTKLAEVQSDMEKQNKFVDESGRALTGMALHKAEGNEHFKMGRYEDAIKCYTKALECTTDAKERSTLFSNRAASWSQYQNWSKMLEDCNSALALDTNNVKALIRRGLAYEGLEKYTPALADMKQALSLEPESKMASSAIVRLSRATR